MTHYLTYGVFGENADAVAENFGRLVEEVVRFAEKHGHTLKRCIRKGGVCPRMWRAGFRFADADMPDAALLCEAFERHIRNDTDIMFYYDAKSFFG